MLIIAAKKAEFEKRNAQFQDLVNQLLDTRIEAEELAIAVSLVTQETIDAELQGIDFLQECVTSYASLKNATIDELKKAREVFKRNTSR
jgi:hypothetical protein